VVLKFYSCTCRTKKCHPTFDRLIGGGLTFGDLMVISDFLFDRCVFIGLPRPPLLPGTRGLLLFTTISLADGTGARSGLDYYISRNVCFHHTYK
jgi:hypothetical protein